MATVSEIKGRDQRTKIPSQWYRTEFHSSAQSPTKVETNDFSPEQNQNANNIARNDKAQKLYKCDICSFSAKHPQNLRVHKERFIPFYTVL